MSLLAQDLSVILIAFKKKKSKPGKISKSTILAFRTNYDLAQWPPVSSVTVSLSCLCPITLSF